MSESESDTEASAYRVPLAGTPDGGKRAPDLSPREAMERWLAKLKVSKADATVSAYYYRLKLFAEWAEDEGVESINDLSGWDIESYEAQRRDADVKPLTLQREMETLKLLLEYCARIELVDSDLPERVDIPDVPRDAHVNDSMLQPDDARLLIESYRGDQPNRASRGHILLEIAWFTGARLGALRALDLQDYNSDEEFVRFVHRPNEDTPLKNGNDGERIVGLPSEVCEIIDEFLTEHRQPVFDDFGREPLLASQKGRPAQNTVRVWMYLATVPCHHSPCPHGEDPNTCPFLDHSEASKCPSSRSPHRVRTGSITWQLNQNIPIDVVSKRVNSSARVIEEHYDKPDPLKEMKKRRRPHLDQLGFESDGEAQE